MSLRIHQRYRRSRRTAAGEVTPSRIRSPASHGESHSCLGGPATGAHAICVTQGTHLRGLYARARQRNHQGESSLARPPSAPRTLYAIQDGHVVVWHDEEIVRAKCRDTAPAVRNRGSHRGVWRCSARVQYPGDPDYPYVGKYIANLTLAQLRTLDCGSTRQYGYRERARPTAPAAHPVTAGPRTQPCSSRTRARAYPRCRKFSTLSGAPTPRTKCSGTSSRRSTPAIRTGHAGSRTSSACSTRFSRRARTRTLSPCANFPRDDCAIVLTFPAAVPEFRLEDDRGHEGESHRSHARFHFADAVHRSSTLPSPPLLSSTSMLKLLERTSHQCSDIFL